MSAYQPRNATEIRVTRKEPLVLPQSFTVGEHTLTLHRDRSVDLVWADGSDRKRAVVMSFAELQQLLRIVSIWEMGMFWEDNP